MNYTSPVIEGHEPIADPFVLGLSYKTPTWTDHADADNQDPA
jgi:hypothetical protein